MQKSEMSQTRPEPPKPSLILTRRDPVVLAVGAVLALTALRLLALALSDADLFVDEAQYWLWGQELDWGYYSKPPLIGWLIRAVTDLAGSDAALWVRLPGPILHGITALLLMGAAAEILTRAQAACVALAYASLPMVALASVLISTDTLLLPFWAAALWLWLRQVQRGASWGAALAMGICLGLGMMGKYAAIYFLIGAALGMAFVPQMRLPMRHLALAALGFVGVILPNVLWNIAHDLQTLQHTADNVDWVRQDNGPGLNLDKLLEFLASQLAVMGPVLFLAYLWAVGRELRPGQAQASPMLRSLIAFSLPVLLIVCLQALLSKAYANWAAMTYPAGVILVVAVLWDNGKDRARGLLWVGIGANLLLSLALAFAATQVTDWRRGGAHDGDLVLSRYTGRRAMAEATLATARAEGLPTVVASSRQVLADLFYHARDAREAGSIAIFAAPYRGATPHYYAQKHLLPAGAAGPLLFVSPDAPCDTARLIAPYRPQQGAYLREKLKFFAVGPACLGGAQ